MKSRDLQSRLFYPTKLSFRIKGQIKRFSDKKKLKEFIKTKPVLKITNMNNKMATNTYLTTIEPKKQSKQKRTELWLQRAF